jgi:photosystem II stability/assembly factor-like uncharacterized protein
MRCRFAALALLVIAIGVSATLLAAVTLRWTAQTSGGAASLRGVSAVSDSVAWASGSGSTVLRTADGGKTWQPQTVTSDRLDFRDVNAIDARTAYALSIGNGPASRIYKTTDAGATWTLQHTNQDPKGFLDAMAFWDATHGVAVGDSVNGAFSILLTEDGGNTWTPAPPSGLPPALPGEGAFAGSGTNVAVHGANDAWFATGAAAKSRVLHTSDRGRTWTVADTPLGAGPSTGAFSIAFRDATHGVVVGGDYQKEAAAVDNLAITSDGGRTWTLTRDRKLSGFRSVVAYVPGSKMSLIALGPQGADWSDDDGRSWSPIDGAGFHTFSFSPSGRTGFGAGGKGAIGRVEISGR